MLASLLAFSPLLEGGTTHQAVMVLRFATLLLLARYLWTGVRDGTLTLARTPTTAAVLAYLLLATVSTTVSPYTHQSLQWLIVLFTYAVLLYVTAWLVREWTHIDTLIIVLIGTALFETLLTFHRTWQGAVRPHGTFFNPNFLAAYLITIGLPVLGYLCYRRTRSLVWFAGALTLALFLLAVVITESRGGLVALVVGTGVVLGIRFRWKGLAALVLLLALSLLAPNPLRDRIRTEHAFNPVGYARLQIWQSSMASMIDRPTGWGLGLYQYVYPRYARPVEGQIARYGKTAQTAHNEYLQMGVELGVISVVIFLWGALLVLRGVRRTLSRRMHRPHRGMLVGLVAGIVAILVHAAVDSSLHEPALAILLAVYVGMVLSISRLVTGTSDLTWGIPVQLRPVLAGGSALGMALIAVVVLRFGLGWMAYESGLAARDPDRAIPPYQTAIDLDPGKALYHSALASAYFKRYQTAGDGAAAEQAIHELKTAMALNPLDGRLAGLLGHVYLILSASQPSAAPALQDQSVLLRSAIAAYEQSVVLEPFTPSHRLALGQLFAASGQPQTAEAHVRQGLVIEPNFLPAREWLVRHYLAAGRMELAQQEYEEILRRQRDFAGRPKDSVEERYLNVDAAALGSALKAVRRPT